MTDNDTAAAAAEHDLLLTIDEAHAVLKHLPESGREGTVADLLRQVIAAGRDTRVVLEDDRRPGLRQYATLAELAGAAEPSNAEARVASAQALLARWRHVRARVTIPGHYLATFYDDLAAAVGTPAAVTQSRPLCTLHGSDCRGAATGRGCVGLPTDGGPR